MNCLVDKMSGNSVKACLFCTNYSQSPKMFREKQQLFTSEKLEPVKVWSFCLIDYENCRPINWSSPLLSSLHLCVVQWWIAVPVHWMQSCIFSPLVCHPVMHPLSLCSSHLICLSHTNTHQHSHSKLSLGCLTLTVVTFSKPLTDCCWFFFYSISASSSTF